jgi:hypothetical protein
MTRTASLTVLSPTPKRVATCHRGASAFRDSSASAFSCLFLLRSRTSACRAFIQSFLGEQLKVRQNGAGVGRETGFVLPIARFASRSSEVIRDHALGAPTIMAGVGNLERHRLPVVIPARTSSIARPPEAGGGGSALTPSRRFLGRGCGRSLRRLVSPGRWHHRGTPRQYRP